MAFTIVAEPAHRRGRARATLVCTSVSQSVDVEVDERRHSCVRDLVPRKTNRAADDPTDATSAGPSSAREHRDATPRARNLGPDIFGCQAPVLSMSRKPVGQRCLDGATETEWQRQERDLSISLLIDSRSRRGSSFSNRRFEHRLMDLSFTAQRCRL